MGYHSLRVSDSVETISIVKSYSYAKYPSRRGDKVCRGMTVMEVIFKSSN